MSSKANTPNQVILVIGPTKSGKSEWAESLAIESSKPVIYIATAPVDPTDREWQLRIEQHRCRRPSNWLTLEVSHQLVETIESVSRMNCLVVDSLGTWVANLLEQDDKEWEKTAQDLILSLQQVTGDVIFVAEETGWGVVPAYPSGRKFRDRLGALVRQLGTVAHPVYLVTGGHVLNLSTLGFPLPR